MKKRQKNIGFCFKKLMYNKNIRRNIIAALLNIHPEEVEETTLLATILRKQSADDKYGILDVRVKLKNGVQMDFEMQVIYLDYWENRSVYYLSKMCSEQLKEGQGYEELQKCIQVSILNHTFFEDDEECYRRIALCDTKTGREYTDRLEMHILELTKIPPAEEGESDLLQWMRFLGGKSREEFKKMAEKKTCFEEAYDVLDKLSADEIKRLEYEAREKAIKDYNTQMWSAENRGLQKGREEGREELIHSMLKVGLPIEKIAEIAGMTETEIREIECK